MVFCHLSKAQSIREVTNGLLSAGGNVNHLGIIRKVPTKSSLSYINSTRDWRVFREYFFALYESLQHRGYFKRKKFFKIKKKIFMLDSTIIPLCLKVFDWARYRKEKGAIKLHILLDYDGCMPKYLFITEGRQSDVKHAKYMSLPPNSVLVIDRGYIDFKLLNQWSQENIFFVTMIKDSIKYTSVEEKPLPEGKWENILKDEIIELSGLETKQSYPEKLRRLVVYDEKQKRTIELLTNNFNWTAETISELYRQRWQL
jgi:IS4 transposase